MTYAILDAYVRLSEMTDRVFPTRMTVTGSIVERYVWPVEGSAEMDTAPQAKALASTMADVPLLSDVKRIYVEEALDDEQAAALDAMLMENAKNPLPVGKRIPRR